MAQERNTRPFTARSVIASLLLGTRPPRLAGADLVRAAAALGCAEGTTRVALSRMAAAGELSARDGWYALTGSLVERQSRQEEGRRPALRPWDGTWVLAVVGGAGARAAGERAELRRRLLELRLAEWREGLWARPDNLAAPRPELDGCTWVLGARPAEVPPLWEVDAWAADAGALLDAMAATPPTDLRAAFALAASVVRHLRDDPLLPDALLPANWPGDRLRAAYDDYEAGFRAALRPVFFAQDVR